VEGGLFGGAEREDISCPSEYVEGNIVNRVSDLESLLSSEAAIAMANLDYIVAILNTKAAQCTESPEKMGLLTEILQEIKLVMTPTNSLEIH